MRSQKQNQKVRILILLLICLAAVIFSDFMIMGSTNAAPTYAIFMEGPSFQSSITSIVTPRDVKEVRRDTTCDPHGHHAIDISDSASPASIYARSDDGKTLYYCSDAETLYLNKDSSTMFSGFSSATVIETQGWDTSEAKEMQYMFYGCERLANLDVSNFDSSHALHVNSMFEGCESLTSLDLRRFRADTVLDMNRMFAGCKYLTTLKQNFDTSRVTNMKAMFEGCGVLPDLDVSHWDTINVTDMSYMFHGCNILTNLDVSNWRTSSVKDMSYMFQSCGNLTGLNVSSWDTINVKNMNSMFSNCRSLSELDVRHWDTRRVEDMSNMFSNCDRVTGLNVSNWDTSNVTNMSRMFNGCQNLTNLDVRGFVTSSVTDMSHMFHACTSLTGIDVSHFDTRNVRDMSYMFTKCINVNNLDVGNFVTSNVTNMSHMFDSCSSLTGLDFRNFDTHNVTDMSYMFNECASLPNLDMSYFDTSSVRNMSYMFGGCSSLPDLDLSHFDVRNVEIMSYMFYNCSGLKKIGHNFDTRSAETMSHMFAGCERLADLDVSNFSTYNVTDMRHMFDSCKTLTSLDLRNWDTTNVAHMEGMFKDCNHLTELKQNFNTRAVRTMDQMFQGCTNLERLDLSRWDTRNVTKMGDMFNGCAKIRDLDLGSFRTDRVQDMQRMFSGCSNLENMKILNLVTTGTTNTSYMFKGCSSLKELSLNNWDTSNVINMTEMFQGCDNLKYIYVSATGFRTNNVINSVDMFANSPNLIGGHGTKWDSGYVSQSRAVPDSETASGYLTYDIAVSFKNSAGTELARQIINVGDTATAPSITGYHVLGYYTNPGLTNGFNLNSTLSNYTQVYLDWECTSGYVLKSGQCVEPITTTFLAGTTVNTILKSLATGATLTNRNTTDTLIQQIVRTGAITQGVTTTGLSTSTSETPIIAWYDNHTIYYYTDADVIYLNRSSSSMFSKISSVIYIDTSGWNTHNVRNMSNMFNGCGSLTGLDVSNWDTHNVTSMNSMFASCRSLTGLDVSNWDTSSVTSMQDMFRDCSSLTGLDVSNWDTSSVTSVFQMFFYCSSLENLNVSSWDTSSMQGMGSMFADCHSLTGLDVSNWDTSRVTDMHQMFANCRSLTGLDVSNFVTSGVTDMYSMFMGCSSLTGLDVSNWDTSRVTDMHKMFASCSSLTGLDVSNFDTHNVTNMSDMFRGCSSLIGLDVSNWDTSSVTNMSQMFRDCSSLTGLDVSNWVTSGVTNMRSMFAYCNSLTGLDVSNWNTSNVTDMTAVFEACISLTGLDVSNWNTSKVTDMSYMFDQCKNLAELDVSSWNTSRVTKMKCMFQQCYNLTELDVSNWNTSGVTDMSYMFSACYNLNTIYASTGFITSGVTNSNYMFQNDSKLIGGYGTKRSSSYTDRTRAVIDSATASGYFTDDIVVSFKSISNGVELARQIINVGDRAVVPTITGYYVLGYYSNVGMSGTFDFSQNLTKFTEVYVNWNECDTGYLLKNGLCVAPLTATFEQGTAVNTALKSLATGATVSDYQKQDTLIQQIVRTGAVAQGVTTRVISTPTSEVPIVAWYDNHTIYYYTEADTIYLNQDSSSMFLRISSGTYIDTSGWDASRVTDMHQMFMECHSLETLDVSDWDTSRVTDMHQMFMECHSLETLDVSDWDTSSVTTMEGMFSECSSLTGLDVSNWDTSSVTDMHQMFEGCTGLTELDVSNWDTSSVTTMEGMFAYCSSLTGLDVSNWDTSNVRDMSYMFSRCNRLTELDLRNWDTSRVTNMYQMFIRCASLKTIYASTGFVVTGVTNSTNMFRSTSLIGGHGTRQNILGYTDKSGAVLDSETASGYLTYDIAIRYKDRYNRELARQIINVGSSTVAPVITGYRVLGYYTDSNMNTPFVFNQNLRKYTEVYVDVAYVVTFDENGADSVGAHSLSGSSVVLPSITRNGGTVLGWSTNSGDTLPKYQVGETFNPRADTTLYAITKKTYTATFEQNGADSISTSTATCDVYNSETTCSGSGTITMCNEGECRVISDRNLGASISGTGGTCSYGNYYQWGNNYGFSNTGTISTSSTRVNASGYGPGNYYLGSTFIVTSSTPYDWSSVPNLNLRGEGPTTTTEVRQGPCPDGYHVPSKKEWDKMSRMWEELVYDGNSSTIGEQFRETFKLPFAGLRDFSSAAVSEQGEAAYYWLSTPYDGINNDQAHRLYFTSDSRDLNNTDYRANGFPIRCFKNESRRGPIGVSYQVRGINIPEITRDGWTVLGWSTNSGDTTAQYSGCDEILLSGDTTFYAITSKPASATFKPNGNKLDNQSSDVNRNCTMYNTQTGCQITTPTITASGNNTPTIVGYTTSSSGTDTASIGSNANHLIAGGETLYAHTMKAAETYTVNFDANGNTLDTNSVSCSIAATYDGNQQASSCNTTCPTITASVNTPNILGFSSGASNHDTFVCDNHGAISLNSGNNGATYYAQTTTPAITHTVTFYKNGAASQTPYGGSPTAAESLTQQCTRAATFNGVAQSGSCNIKSPTITPISRYGVVGYAETSGATVSTWTHNTDKSISSDATYYAITKPLTTTFLPGNTVNTILKSLATGATVTDYQKSDILIQQIVRTGTIAQGVTTRVISTSTSEVPIIAWYDNHTIYYYTEADTVYLNQNSSYMFYNIKSVTDIDTSGWNTSSVTNMSHMFSFCQSLTGLNVSNWNTSNVTNMNNIFNYCKSLTGLDVSNWDTSRVTNMAGMFNYCQSLRKLDVSNWDTGSGTIMGSMFTSCSSLTGLDIKNWDTSNVTNMSQMFYGCSSLTGLDVSHWDTSSVRIMNGMFYGCSNLRELDISNWDTSSGTNMSQMFYGCSRLTELDVSSWNTSSVTTMESMFNGCSSLTGLDVSSWNTSSVTNMNKMFNNCSSLTGLDVSSWNTSSVTNMAYIFNWCVSLTDLDVSNWNTNNVTNMNSVFRDCRSLTGLDVSSWNTSKVTSMGSMFRGCYNLLDLDISNFDTSNVTDMGAMFGECHNLETINLGNFDTTNVSVVATFEQCYNLNTIYASTGFGGVGISYSMFNNTPKLIGGHGTKYPSLGMTKSGAVLDSETQSGYLTYDIAVSYRTAGGTELTRQVINVGSSTVSPTITGYHVLGYYSNSGLSVPFDFNQNLRKYTEVYVDYNFVATFEENGATSIGASTLSGLSVVTPSITRDGWTVLGWSTNSGDTLAQYEVGETIPLTGDITLYAITKKTYTATFEQNGADSIGTSSATCDVYNIETTCRAAGTITICNPNNPGECLTMMDRNLGASVAGTGFCSYGNFYQWGNDYGFSNTGSVTTAGGKVDCTPYGDGNDYSSSTFRLSSDNWCSTQVDNLWGGANDVNNNGYGYIGGVVLNLTGRQGPCPDGYHVPSIGEWGSALSRWASGYALSGNSITLQGTAPLTYFENNGNASSAFRDYFMVPLAGYRHRSYATLTSLGTLASLWSSSYYNNYREARSLYVNSSKVKADPTNNRASAYSIRCFKDSADSTVNTKNIVDSISAPSITRDGWDIIGWNTNSGATTAQYFGCDEILLSGDITLYAITSRSASTTFKPNGNKLNGQTDDVNENCTMYNTQTGCQITTPTITASGSNTPTVVGYTTSSIGTGTATIGSNSNISISGGETYYAHTKKAAVTLTAKWNANGATLSSTADRTCQLAEVYNGAAQATSCTVDAPTITAPSNTPTILGFNTTAGANSNHANYDISTNKLTLTSALDNQTWYAQTTAPAITHTVTFYKNGASTQTNAGGTAVTDETVTRTCTRAATFNGAQQASTCSITSPTIVGTSNTPNIIGYSTGANNHVSTWNHNTLKTDISSDLTYYAQTQSDQWTYGMSFSGNGNSIIPTSKTCNTAITYNNSSPTQSCNTTCPTITPPSGFTPIGFSTSANAHNAGVCTNGGSITLNPTNSGSTAYAQSSRDRTVTVTFDKNGNGGSTSTQTCNPATEYNGETHSCTVTCLDITPANGFTTIGWSSAAGTHIADACLTGGTSPSVSSDTTYYAQSSKSYNKITINFNVNGNGGTDSTGECTPATVYNGATGGSCSITSPTITAPSGFTTIGWNSNSNTHASEWNENTAKDVTENATYYAQSSRDRVVTVTFNNNGNGGSTTTQTCNPATEYNGEIHSCAVTCPDITPANGFTTIGWGSATGTHSADVCFTGGTSPSLSGDATYYAQTWKVTTATYKPNGNLLDGGTADLTRSCTGYNGASTCNVTTPTISNAATTYVIGYSSSAISHTSNVGSNVTHTISTAGGGTWYAQTQAPDKLYATFKIQDRNAAYMRQSVLSSKKYTMDKSCTKYNGETSCSITSPTINNENNSRYTIIGWNTDPYATESSLTPGNSRYINNDTTYYSITRDNNTSRTIMFNANGNIINGNSSVTAYKYNGENGWRAMSPGISPAAGFITIGWSNGQNRYENDWTPGTIKLLTDSDSSIYYAQSYKTISARFDPNRNRLDGLTSQVRKYCTGYNGALSCTVTTPTITNPITTTVVGYTTSSSRTDSASIGSNVSYSIENGKTYYAHTKKVVTATYKPNGNLLNGVSADVIKSCVGYDGDSTCNITTPTISNTTTTGVIGYSNNSTSHAGTVGSNAVHTIYIAGGGGTRYAQTQGILSHTGYFYKNGADRQTNASGTSVPHDVVTRTCSVTVYNGSTGFSCDITSPTITRNGFNPLGYNTDSYAYTSNWPQNTSKTISGDVTYYAITNKNVRATFVMGTGVSSILIDNLGCTIWNSATSCNINLSSMECNTSAGYTTPKWNGTLNPGTSVSLSSNTTYTGTCSDTTPPTCNWGTPTNTCVSGGVAGTITLTCTDGVGISQTSINANDVVYDTSLLTLSDGSTENGTSMTKTYTFTYIGKPGINGTTDFTLKTGAVEDTSNNGNVTESQSQTLQIDNAGPSAPILNTVTSPTNDTTPTLSWNAVMSDNGCSSVSGYEVRVCTTPDCTSATRSTTTTGTIRNVSAALPDTDKTTYYWKVRTKDVLGNRGDWSSTGSFILDTTAPDSDGSHGSALPEYVNSGSNITVDLRIAEIVGMNTSEFSQSDVHIYVGGVEIYPNKTLTYNGDNVGVYTYSLTLSNLTRDGALKVVVPAGSFTDNAGNQNNTLEWNNLTTVDNTLPTYTLDSTANPKSSSQRLTGVCSDNEGITQYYIGNSQTPNYTAISSTGSFTTGIDVTSAGTYYLFCKDAAGNVVSGSKTYNSYTVYNMLETITGASGQYNTQNYVSASSATYIAPKLTIFTLANIYTVPNNASVDTYRGYSTGNNVVTTNMSSITTLNGDSTYYAWFDRQRYTLDLVINTGINLIKYKVNGADSYASTQSTLENIVVKAGSSISAYATAKSGYTHTQTSLSDPWTVASVSSNNVFSPVTVANTDTHYTVYHYVKIAGESGYLLSKTETILSGTTDAVVLLSSLAQESEFLCAHYSSGSLTGTESGPGEIVTHATIRGDGSTKIYLYYIRNTRTVTLSGDAHIQTLEGDGTVRECGSEVPVNAIPKPGYHFVRWDKEERREEGEGHTE